MPKKDFNAATDSKDSHHQGAKGGKGGEIAKAGHSAGDGKGHDGNKQIGPFDERGDEKRPRVSSEDQKSGSMGGER